MAYKIHTIYILVNFPTEIFSLQDNFCGGPFLIDSRSISFYFVDSRLYLDILKLLFTLQDLFKLRSTSCLKAGSMIVDERIKSDALFNYQLWPRYCDCLLKEPVTCTVFTNISLKVVIALTEGVGLIEINCFSMNFGLRTVTVY